MAADRVALCIGCDRYVGFPPLGSAGGDAARIFDVLTDPELGGYDPGRSRLLIDPSTNVLRETLNDLLYGGRSVTDFTFFFAGHGVLRHETFYLVFPESVPSSIALTGFAFAELARVVAAARPSQANFVVDACCSAGLGLDLASVLRQGLTATQDATGVAALAAAAADEQAFETAEGGAFTSALLGLLRGQRVLGRDKPYLDVPGLGDALHGLGGIAGRQTVSAWMLNLQGTNRFSRNPHFDGSDVAQPRETPLPRLDLTPTDVASVRRAMLDLHEGVDGIAIGALGARMVKDLNPDAAVAFLSGLAESMSREAQGSDDPFAEGRVLGVLVGQLLPFSSGAGQAGDAIRRCMRRAAAADLEALRTLDRRLAAEPLCLVSGGSPAEFFLLPLRVSHLLGSIGVLLLDPDLASGEADLLADVTTRLLALYGNSILALSDEQAAPLAAFLASAHLRGWTTQVEEVVGRLFDDATRSSGRVARHFLDGVDALAVLDGRLDDIGRPNPELYARPSDLLTVTIVFAALLGLDEVVDGAMILLDHSALSILLPDDPLELGLAGPVSGTNHGLEVGHGIWTCADVRREWFGGVATRLSDPRVADRATSRALVRATVALCDRVPWFLAPTIPRCEGSRASSRSSGS